VINKWSHFGFECKHYACTRVDMRIGACVSREEQNVCCAPKYLRHFHLKSPHDTYLGSADGRTVESWPKNTANGALLSVFVTAPPPASPSSSTPSPTGSTSNVASDLPPILRSVNTVHLSLVGMLPAPRVLAAKMGSGAA
jgi:hypothetical protein